jgi:hypothetical protein
LQLLELCKAQNITITQSFHAAIAVKLASPWTVNDNTMSRYISYVLKDLRDSIKNDATEEELTTGVHHSVVGPLVVDLPLKDEEGGPTTAWIEKACQKALQSVSAVYKEAKMEKVLSWHCTAYVCPHYS